MSNQNPLAVTHPHASQTRALFLRILRSAGTIREAAETVGISANMVRSAMHKDSSFASLVLEALEDHTEILEKEMIRRALNGSDLLLMFALKSRKPDVYREKTTVNTGPTVNMKAYIGFTPDQWDQAQVVESTATQVALDDRSDASDTEANLSVPTPAVADTATT